MYDAYGYCFFVVYGDTDLRLFLGFDTVLGWK